MAYHCHLIQKTYSLLLFGITPNLLYIWIKLFITNQLYLTTMYCEENHDLFKKIAFTITEAGDNKYKIQLLLTYLRGEWYINKIR